mmetsp:Transcript_5137/g.4627  ORF Transcript_5137/g.4627 Transcript_5137/m.4627 type:complete len:172 (-) Transcript_5137:131-646(-)
MKNIIKLLLILLTIQLVYSFNIKSYNKPIICRQQQSNKLINSNSHVYSNINAVVNNQIYSNKSGKSSQLFAITTETDKSTNNIIKAIKSFQKTIVYYIKLLFEQTNKVIQRIAQIAQQKTPASIKVVVTPPEFVQKAFKLGSDETSKAKKYAVENLKKIELSMEEPDEKSL